LSRGNKPALLHVVALDNGKTLPGETSPEELPFWLAMIKHSLEAPNTMILKRQAEAYLAAGSYTSA
jgi:hypothetical protein